MICINILFFLKPKADVAFLKEHFSFGQTLETMEYHRYSAIPILNDAGEYIGTLTEGDILWYCTQLDNFNIMIAKNISLTDIPRRLDYVPVNVNSNIEDLLTKALNQNFIPVVDDCNKFIGIITRKDIIQYCSEHCAKHAEE